jgi:hypothetical protein
MIQRGNGFSFTLEPLAEAGAGHLDRDVAAEPGVARADGLDDLIRAKSCAWR